MAMSEEDITKAVVYYLYKRGYKVKNLVFKTETSYSRVLFDVQVNSRLKGAELTVEKIEE